jgi:hypothetical protein
MNKEIRCYGNHRVANGLVGLMAGGFSLMILGGLLVGNYFVALLFGSIVYPALFLLWYALRRGSFIAVDLDLKTLQASNFFIRTRGIPISSITRIDTRGIFAGAATLIEVTYRRPNGPEKTVGYGTTNFLNHADLRKLLDAIVDINSHLRIPSELRDRITRN